MPNNQAAYINQVFLHQLPIEVWQDGELIGAGVITRHTKEDVVLNDGMHYLKCTCEFIIKEIFTDTK